MLVISLLAAAFLFAASAAHALPLQYKLAPGDTLKYLAGNSIVDIEYDTVGGVPTVWVGTGSGVSVSTDGGATWRTFTSEEGLAANSVSALQLVRDVVWVGMAHNQDFNGDLFPVGDGFSYSINLGETWTASAPDQATGKNFFTTQSFGMLPFDIAGEPIGIWSACFFGGLIRTVDGGTTWKNIYPSLVAKDDLENLKFNDLGNRFFSVTAGPLDSAGDTTEVYAGSAGGINRFLIIDDKLKLAGAPVMSITSDDIGAREWLATAGGITRIDRTVFKHRASFFDSTITSMALGSDMYFSSAAAKGAGDPTTFFAGLFDTTGTDTVGMGIMRTTDLGATWDLIDSAQFVGTGSGAYDMAYSTVALYVAAGDSGLWRSFDYGDTWERLYVDTANKAASDPINHVYAVTYDPGAVQLYVGTENGLFRITMGGGDVIGAYEPPLYQYVSGDTTGAQIIRKVRAFRSGGNLMLWAASHRPSGAVSQRNASLFSNDSGATWQTVHIDLVPYDFAFLRDTTYAATNGGLLVAPMSGGDYVDSLSSVEQVFERLQSGTDSLELRAGFRAIATIRDTIWLGGDHGFAQRRPGNKDWDIEHFIPRDSVDQIQLFRYDPANPGTSISGEFVIALDIQDLDTAKYIWASTRPSDTAHTLAVSRSTDNGQTWSHYLDEVITWNLSSYKENLWAATSDGLYLTTNGGNSWRTFDIFDAANNTSFYGTREVLAVRQIDDNTVLVGSEDGLARSTDLGQTWTITRSFVGLNTPAAGGSDVDVYASPVPFSPNTGRLRIHYKPETNGNVTITVYDFAMQKVATILDGEYRDGRPGPDPFGTNHYIEEWDARNDNGDMVATGVYFFKVETAGTTQWGKLVIIP